MSQQGLTARELKAAALTCISFMGTFLAFGFTFFATNGSFEGLLIMLAIATVGLSLTGIGVAGLLHADNRPGKLVKPPPKQSERDR